LVSRWSESDGYPSVERIRQYMEIEQEPKPIKGDPPAYWPASGDLRVEHLTARYSRDGPEVLHDLSFTVKSGERIGVGEFSFSHRETLC